MNIKDKLKLKDVEWAHYNLNDYDINHCKGCEVCLREDNCLSEDNVQNIKKMLENITKKVA